MVAGTTRDTERSIRIARVDAEDQRREHYRQIFENYISSQFYAVQCHLLGILFPLSLAVATVSCHLPYEER